jgi:molybdopterin converting factor small subunit
MAVEVRIPTILRTYTGGEKAVPGEGTTLSEVIDDLESNHPGIKERLRRRPVRTAPATSGGSSTSTSTTRTSGSPAGWRRR